MDEASKGTFILDIDDRRRLAVAEIEMRLEKEGSVAPLEFGQAILRNVVNEDEVMLMCDMVRMRLGA